MKTDEWCKPPAGFCIGQNNGAPERLQIKRVQKNLTFQVNARMTGKKRGKQSFSDSFFVTTENALWTSTNSRYKTSKTNPCFFL